MKFFNKKSIQLKIIALLLLNSFSGINSSNAFDFKIEHNSQQHCLAPVLQLDNSIFSKLLIDYNREVLSILHTMKYAPQLALGNDRVIGAAIQKNSNQEDPEYWLMLSHRGSPMAADINFLPDNLEQKGNGLGVFNPDQDDYVYELVEFFDNNQSDINSIINPKRMLVTGRSLRVLGMGFYQPLPISVTKIYKFRKVAAQIPSQDKADYNVLLKYSLLNYKRFAPQYRMENSFIAREIIKALNAGSVEFTGLFYALSEMIDDDQKIDFSELSRIFSDIIFYGDQQLKDNAQKILIDIAIAGQIKEISVHGLAKASIVGARSSENAIKLLRSSTVGEIVLTSPESLWSTGTGGMALYVSDLAKELAALGIPVTVIVPLFNEPIRKKEIFQSYNLHDTGRGINLNFGRAGDETAHAKIYEANQEGVRILYLENDKYFNLLKGSDGGDNAYNGSVSFRLRFARMLSLGTLLAIREMNIHPRIIQTNDWTTAYLKAYLEGRERIDPSLEGLRFDPHLQSTKVLSILHNSHAYYQGNMWVPDLAQRDKHIWDDLGFNPEKDTDILVLGHDHTQHDHNPVLRARAWLDINPTYTAVRTGDNIIDVSEGHRDRSINPVYAPEFGYLDGVLGWKASIGDFYGQANGFGLAQRQRDFLSKMLIANKESKVSIKDMAVNISKKNSQSKIEEGYINWLSNPESMLRGFYGISSDQEKSWLNKLCNDLKPQDKSMAEFKLEMRKLLEAELLQKTTKLLRSNIYIALEDKNYFKHDLEYRKMLQDFLDKPEQSIKSFFDIGHESERRRLANFHFEFIKPLQKSILQNIFGIEKDEQKFTYSMLHRVGEQKGHQLLTAEIWNSHNPGSLKAIKGTIFYDKIESHDYEIGLSLEDQNKLSDFANKHNLINLRAMEVAMILNHDVQFVIVGSADGDLDKAFQETYKIFKHTKQFAYLPEFISINSALYDLIYSGSDRFGMPSWYEPGGLSNQEAAGYGTPRHLTRRDGLLDGEIKVEGLRESFEEFNPVAWLVSLQEHSKFFKENKSEERELRYQAITQDNRWLNRARNYVELYRKLAGAERIPELKSLVMTAAIHQAAIRADNDPADEIMRNGYTAEETVDNLINVVKSSSNNVLVSALIEKYIPYLAKILEIRQTLINRIDVIVEECRINGDSGILCQRFEMLRDNIIQLNKITAKEIMPYANVDLATLKLKQKEYILSLKFSFVDQAI
ncbi:MAG: glycogen/starch synthase [Candidatus Omnitrophica bacterium]|nr:glycogen/starch synthase [Candidatus Omnitrophota bacterium]